MEGLKLVILSFLGLLSSQYCTAQKFCSHMGIGEISASAETFDPRADTFDVLRYEIGASFTGLGTDPNMDAVADMEIVLLENANYLHLDLIGLLTQQVEINGTAANYDRRNDQIVIELSGVTAGDTFTAHVQYSGKPVSDSRWGGFYFSGDYAFNLGVGFAADPHNFGRAWFPCFDNFTDRARYQFAIEVDSGFQALCNGELLGTTAMPDKRTAYVWRMDDPIPTYLASVAIAPYELIEYDVDGIPVVLASVASDTTNMKQSFEHLPECIRAFVNQYGEHSFDRVGFNMVPFNGGAMEHATNIAYPRFGIAGGSKTYETLFAHELAHHWWGNTVTCRTQEDMWINEGWASYSERVFLEAVYGREAYKDDIRKNHKAVVHYAHIRDGESLPVSGIGHANTYGMHVYDKGADMVHTLRGFMGDSAFFAACESFQSTFKFKDVSTDDMESHFQGFSEVPLDGFFEQWIKTNGFPQFYILEVEEESNLYRLRIKQNQRFNTMPYTDVTHYVSAFSADMRQTEFKIQLDDEYVTILKSELGFIPVYWALDFNERISDAITDQWIMADSIGTFTMDEALFEGEVVSISDSALIRVEHHWVSPDQYFNKIEGLAMSKERYWTIDGIWPEDFQLAATFEYNGLAPASNPAAGFLDNELIKITEDSLVLLYRPNAISDWQIHPAYVKNTGSVFNKKGEMLVADAKAGQYTFGIYDHQLLSKVDEVATPVKFKIFPNPADDVITITFEDNHPCCLAEITDANGRVVLSKKLKSKKDSFSLDISELPAGLYFVGVVHGNNAYDPQRIVVKD